MTVRKKSIIEGQATELEDKIIAEAGPSKSARRRKSETLRTIKKHPESRPLFMIEIPEENYFCLHDGRVLKDYRELADALESMSDEVFYHHVNDSRNDFANWIEDIFHETELAGRIRTLHGRVQTCAEIYKHIIARMEVLLSH